ncbi:unnamed protein product [Penicillium glandicola]
MAQVKVVGPNGLIPISLQRQAEVRITHEVIYDVVTNCKMISLEESMHAPPEIRDKARADRLAGVENTLEARLKARRLARLGISNDFPRLQGASNDEQAMQVQKENQPAASRATASYAPAAQKNHGIDPRAKPFVPAGPKNEVTHATLKTIPRKITAGIKQGTALRRDVAHDAFPNDTAAKNKRPASSLAKDTVGPKAKTASSLTKAGAGSKDGSTAGSKASGKAESIGDGESTGSSKKPRGVTDPATFMKQVRMLHLQKKMAPKVVPTGPPRRIVFGNLPEWANISSVLYLVYGGAIEHAWSENGDAVVQFVEQDDCIKYYENHSDGIKLKNGDDDLTISVTMPEEGLQDNAELSKRIGEGASRVVCLSGLPSGFRTRDNEVILGMAADPAWRTKNFDHIMIKQAESGIDVYVFFYDLHDGWDFLQDIKDGAYDCIASFEVDPCALAQGFHFVDEPNLMFSGILGVD